MLNSTAELVITTSDAITLQPKVVHQVVNLFRKDQRTVIHFLGAGLELLKILGRCIPSVVLHVYHIQWWNGYVCFGWLGIE
jgi:hypothetical protein